MLSKLCQTYLQKKKKTMQPSSSSYDGTSTAAAPRSREAVLLLRRKGQLRSSSGTEGEHSLSLLPFVKTNTGCLISGSLSYITFAEKQKRYKIKKRYALG